MEKSEAIKILEYNKLWNVSPTLNEAYDVAIASMLKIETHIVSKKSAEQISLSKTIKVINQYFDCDLMSENRKNYNVKGRFVLGYYLRKELNQTLQHIGGMLSKKHETIIHYCNRHEYFYEYDKEYKASYDAFLKEMKNN